MYVVDMYRAVIEHPDFMPPELKNRPDLVGREGQRPRSGRIVPSGHATKTPPRPNLSTGAPIAQAVKTLEHDEPWWRTTVERLLLEKNDTSMIEPLRRLLRDTKSPHTKILAAWLLKPATGRGFSASSSTRWHGTGSPAGRFATGSVVEHAIKNRRAPFRREAILSGCFLVSGAPE